MIQYNYLTVNCNKQIKTVKVWMMSVFSKFQYHSLIQTIFEMTQIKMSCGTNDPLGLNSRLNTALRTPTPFLVKTSYKG